MTRIDTADAYGPFTAEKNIRKAQPGMAERLLTEHALTGRRKV